MKFHVKYLLVICVLGVLIIFIKLFQSLTKEDFTNVEYSETNFPSETKIPCFNEIAKGSYRHHGDYWVLANYIRSTRTFRCNESITYTTHAEYNYLDNLIPLLKRWQGPVSISVYAPGSDFNYAVKRIIYLRECLNSSFLVKEFVNFHLFFDNDHMPPDKIESNPTTLTVDCIEEENSITDSETEHENSYRNESNLIYPINVGRMIARDMATTYFVLASDIELYPSPNLIPLFLDMIRQNGIGAKRKVYVLPIFEAKEYITELPENKENLVTMIRNGSIINFHKFVCPMCHEIPRRERWLKTKAKKEMKVFHIATRKGRYSDWEPIFIGTKYDPEYDTRLSWEGRRDKMTQAYVLCLLDYEFHILDNGFLIHKPGIKIGGGTSSPLQDIIIKNQNTLINEKIYPELNRLYGIKSRCK